METILSLDVGSSRTVLALGQEKEGECNLLAVKYLDTKCDDGAYINDFEAFQSVVLPGCKEIIGGMSVDSMHIGLTGKVLTMTERRVKVQIARRIVTQKDIDHAELECTANSALNDEIIEVIPLTYIIDNGKPISDPIGKHGSTMEVVFRTYMAPIVYMNKLRHVFDDLHIGEIEFFPNITAYNNIFSDDELSSDFALVDLGATSMTIYLYQSKLWRKEIVLPIGVDTIDHDISIAYAVNIDVAKKLKEESGEAWKSKCMNQRAVMPGTIYQTGSRLLAECIQCRMEELLIGVAYQLNYYDFRGVIRLGGGGSCMLNVDALLKVISGFDVKHVRVNTFSTAKDELCRTPQYAVAFGLLLCKNEDVEKEKPNFWKKVINSFRVLG